MGQEGQIVPGVCGGGGVGGSGWVGIPLGPFRLARAGPHLPFERDTVVTGAASHLQHRGTGVGQCPSSSDGVLCPAAGVRTRLQIPSGGEGRSRSSPRWLESYFRLWRAMLERGQMLQELSNNRRMVTSCNRLQWRMQGQERALPTGSVLPYRG